MASELSRPIFHPLYKQIKELLIRKLLSGEWKPGDSLPSEACLARSFAVSQGTIRKALDEMQAEHLVVRHQGRGTFVTARSSGTPWAWFSLVTRDRKKFAERSTKSLVCHSGEASEEEASDLHLSPGDPVLRVTRVRVIGEVPVFSETMTVTEGRFPGLPGLMEKEPQANIYSLLEREFGIITTRCDEYLTAIAADSETARLLGLDPGTPLIEILRIGYTLDDSPLDRRIIRLNPAMCLYHNALG